MNRIFRVEDFDFFVKKKLSFKEQNDLSLFIDSLRENIFLGKPLSYSFLREKKFGSKRVYFLVYEDEQIVLLVGVSDKKAQQQTINHIKEYLPYYKKLIDTFSTQ